MCVPLNYLTSERHGAIEMQHNNNNNNDTCDSIARCARNLQDEHTTLGMHCTNMQQVWDLE